jgi:hypothetical protein
MKPKHISLIILLALLFAACAPKATPMPTPDIGAIQTAAAQTVIAEISATAAAAASLTPLASPTSAAPTVTMTMTVAPLTTPGITGTPLGLCDDAVWVADVTVPDGTVITPGSEFLKTWKVRNTGACTWGAGYAVVYAYGEKMNGTPAAISVPVTPNQEVEVSVQFKAPTKVGEYASTWRMVNALGSAFGQFFYVKIIVR